VRAGATHTPAGPDVHFPSRPADPEYLYLTTTNPGAFSFYTHHTWSNRVEGIEANAALLGSLIMVARGQ
jgi:hypothetical protein